LSGLLKRNKMAEKRMSLKERRQADARGVDAIITAPTTPTADAVVYEAKPEVSKVTLYIRPDQVVALERIQLEQREKTGKKPDKSVLVQEALDLLTEKYRSQ